MSTLPIIEISVRELHSVVSLMLSERELQLDAHVKAAVNEFCQPERIAMLVREAAHQAIDQAAQTSVKNFFSYGAGRAAIDAAVKEKLEAALPGLEVLP